MTAPVSIDPEAVIAAYRSLASKKETLRWDGGPDGKRQILSFKTSNGAVVFVSMMPVPIRTGEVERAARFSLSALMGIENVMPPHKAHLMVVLRRATPHLLQHLDRFTSVLASVMRASPAVGVYWGQAGAAHRRTFFLRIASERHHGSRVCLWTGVSVARKADGRLSLLSLGMKQLGLPDLLLNAPRNRSVSSVVELFVDLLGYAAKRGKPIPEGDTVGRSQTERLPVHYVTSPIDPQAKVWQIDWW